MSEIENQDSGFDDLFSVEHDLFSVEHEPDCQVFGLSFDVLCGIVVLFLLELVFVSITVDSTNKLRQHMPPDSTFYQPR